MCDFLLNKIDIKLNRDSLISDYLEFIFEICIL